MLTEDDLQAARTAKGGWSRAQLAAWGVPWPPPKGWKRALLGKENASPSTDTARKVKADHSVEKHTRPLVRVDPQSHRDDGSPVAGDGQAYVTRTGKLFHTQWCSIMAAHWRDNQGGIYVTMIADVGLLGSCTQCDTDPEMMEHFRFERAEWQRLNDELDRLGRIIARILVAKGPEAVNQLGPHVIRFRETEAELNNLSRRVAGVFPDSYKAPNW